MNDPPRPLPVLIVVGMGREGRIARGAGRVTVGVEPLEERLKRGAAGVISFGLCGALDPGLIVGDLVIGAGVTAPSGAHTCDRAWIASLARRIPGGRVGQFAAASGIVSDAASKADLWGSSGAVAIDLESAAVATWAARAQVPFAILRCVSDAADRTLPGAAVAAFGKSGRIAYGRMLAALIRRPADLKELMRTGREAGLAFRTLRNARDLLGAGLGCPYVGEHLVDMA